MTKNFWVAGTAAAGVILCIFGNSAFAAVGVILGIGSGAIGVYFLVGFFSAQNRSPLIGGGLIVLGIALILLCVFSGRAAFFLGGIIMLAAGVVLFPVCGRWGRMLYPLCFGCMAVGAVILLAPSLIGWLCVVIGILLIVYSGLLLVYL